MSIINATRLLESHEIAQQRLNRSINWRREPSRFLSSLCFTPIFLYTGRRDARRRFLRTLSKIASQERWNDATIAKRIVCKQSHVYM